jgi:hypothetical protein
VKTVFVDTSGFYAFLDGKDHFHGKAKSAFLAAEKEGWRLVTTNYVLHESWALIQARLGWSAVEAWRSNMVSICEIAWVDQHIHELGEARCRQARERRLSLTDCVSIESMKRNGVLFAIADDEHFKREGFKLP